MPLPKSFRSFADFERDVLRPHQRLGLTVEEMVEDPVFDAEIELEGDLFDRVDDDD